MFSSFHLSLVLAITLGGCKQKQKFLPEYLLATSEVLKLG